MDYFVDGESRKESTRRRRDAITGYHIQPSSKPQPLFWAPVLIQNKWKRSYGLKPLGPKEQKQLPCEKNRGTLSFFLSHTIINWWAKGGSTNLPVMRERDVLASRTCFYDRSILCTRTGARAHKDHLSPSTHLIFPYFQ